MYKKIKCPCCHRKVIKTHPNQKFCLDNIECYRKRQRKYHKKYMKIYYKKYYQIPSEKSEKPEKNGIY